MVIKIYKDRLTRIISKIIVFMMRDQLLSPLQNVTIKYMKNVHTPTKLRKFVDEMLEVLNH